MTGTSKSSPLAVERNRSELEVPAAIKRLLVDGDHDAARELFGDLVLHHQRRASRIAFHYLRDTADADEAVQDAFMKVFGNLTSYREELSFDVWFTRILINGCLDRLKARGRRDRWLSPLIDDQIPPGEKLSGNAAARAASGTPEAVLLNRENGNRLRRALSRLPDRQRAVFILTQVDERPTKEVGAITGLSESTIRVHLFRAMRKLRTLLADDDSVALPRRAKSACQEEAK